MAIVVEDGTGVAGAESYGSLAGLKAYWLARPHNALAAAVVAATDANLEGALRESTSFLDATYGAFYRGVRSGYVQGLLFPRDALDDAGYPLPGLPQELVAACYELAARALAGVLAADVERGGGIKRERVKVGPIEEEKEYHGNAPADPRYGTVDGILGPILNGQQFGAAPMWNWA